MLVSIWNSILKQRFAAWRSCGFLDLSRPQRLEHKTVNTPQKLMRGRMFN